MELTGALANFWYFRNYLDEANDWLRAAISIKDTSNARGSVQAQAKALLGAGHVAMAKGDYLAARARLEERVALWRQMGPAGRLGLADALSMLGPVTDAFGDPTTAHRYLEEGMAIVRIVDLDRDIGVVSGDDCSIVVDLGANDEQAALVQITDLVR